MRAPPARMCVVSTSHILRRRRARSRCRSRQGADKGGLVAENSRGDGDIRLGAAMVTSRQSICEKRRWPGQLSRRRSSPKVTMRAMVRSRYGNAGAGALTGINEDLTKRKAGNEGAKMGRHAIVEARRRLKRRSAGAFALPGVRRHENRRGSANPMPNAYPAPRPRRRGRFLRHERGMPFEIRGDHGPGGVVGACLFEMSSAASTCWSHFLRLRQSSSLIFQCL